MSIQVEELNGTNCKTYLLTNGDLAILVDPVRERVETYRRELIERRLTLQLVLETHTHADHLMFSRDIIDALKVPVVMHELSPSPLVSQHVVHGDTIELGDERIEVLHTPGHTPDSVSYVLPGAVLTGDTLMINGSGRTDFPGGDPGAQYDAITKLLFALPDDTVVWPGHDYRGNTQSTIGEQKQSNPRVAGKSRDEYIDIMNNLGLPYPVRIQQALQVNQSGFETHEVAFPSIADVAEAAPITPAELEQALGTDTPPLVLDVREPEEFVGELGHIRGALLVPLDSLRPRLPKLHGYAERTVVLVCRAGARSASACPLFTQSGFAEVRNLTGGMLAWREAGYAVEH